MTPLESAKEIVRQGGECYGMNCGDCPFIGKPCGGLALLRNAEKFIKENDDEKE